MAYSFIPPTEHVGGIKRKQCLLTHMSKMHLELKLNPSLRCMFKAVFLQLTNVYIHFPKTSKAIKPFPLSLLYLC